MSFSRYPGKPSGRRCRGSTLIELLVAMAILTVAIFALLGAFFWSARVILAARHNALAQKIAAQELEILRASSFSNLPANQTNGALVGTIQGLSLLPQGQATLTVANEPPGNQNAKKMTVRVSWVESGKIKTIQVETLANVGGINQ